MRQETLKRVFDLLKVAGETLPFAPAPEVVLTAANAVDVLAESQNPELPPQARRLGERYAALMFQSVGVVLGEVRFALAGLLVETLCGNRPPVSSPDSFIPVLTVEDEERPLPL